MATILSRKNIENGSRGFQSYQVVCRSLLMRPYLSKFCHMITSLAAREISPSPVYMAALMLHLKDISDRQLNVNVAYNVLGLCNRDEKDAYLSHIQSFTEKNMTCSQINERSNGSMVCGQRGMKGKLMCSYHVRKVKFAKNYPFLHIVFVLQIN